MSRIKKFLIPSFAMAGIVANNSLSKKTTDYIDGENIDDWAKDQFERDQHFMMAGHAHRSHGSHASLGSHRSSSPSPSIPTPELIYLQ